MKEHISQQFRPPNVKHFFHFSWGDRLTGFRDREKRSRYSYSGKLKFLPSLCVCAYFGELVILAVFGLTECGLTGAGSIKTLCINNAFVSALPARSPGRLGGRK